MPAKKDGGKKKAPEKSEEPETEPGKEPGKEDEGGKSLGSSIASSSDFRNFVIFLTGLLVCGAIMIVILYVLKLLPNEKLLQAVAEIRAYIVTTPQFEALPDPEILMEAKQRADYYSNWRRQKLEMEGVVRNIERLKKDGWKAYGGHLYYPSPMMATGIAARSLCENYKGFLASVNSNEEEEFLEKIVKDTKSAHWIGLRRYRETWVWQNQDKFISQFWNTGMPTAFNNAKDRLEQNSCVAIIVSCQQHACWNIFTCKTQNRFFCEMYPNVEYFP